MPFTQPEGVLLPLPVTPTRDNENVVWLGTYGIEKSTFDKNEKLGIEDVQVIYDSCRDFVDFDNQYEASC